MNEPKISVVIPLYNAEKYIRECLISVLASKFQDYEVLVVDDCSTDNSVAEVKKLLPHFDGRLKIFSTEKNSGGAGIPRNVGIKNAAGKYVTFIDNDDMILPDALGNFFATAENFAAEVVHTEKFLYFEREFNRAKTYLYFKGDKSSMIDKPTPEPADLNARINHFISGNYPFCPWGKIFRRDFLLENRIDFPQTRYAEDTTFNFKCFCLSENYILVPYVTNIHRVGMFSGSYRCFRTSKEAVFDWLNIVLKYSAILDDFMRGLEFFKVNSARRFDVLKFLIERDFKIIDTLFVNSELHEVQEIFFDLLQNSDLDTAGKNLVLAYFYADRIINRTR